MIVKEIRYLKLRRLIREAGNQVKLAGLAHTDPAYISQIVTRSKTPSGKERGVGDELARALETAMKKPRGWMDQADDLSPAEALPDDKAIELVRKMNLSEEGALSGDDARDLLAGRLSLGLRTVQDRIRIPRYDSYASMGRGVSVQEHLDVIETIEADLPALRRSVSFTAPQNLCLITGFGDSMEPTFSDGDPLLVDTGVQEIRIDSVYVLERNKELYIKRLQRRPDGTFLMISDNKNYPPYVIADIKAEQFEVKGRVLLAWHARKL